MRFILPLCVFLTLVLLAIGCAGPASRIPLRPGPALEAQTRLLQHARSAHAQGQYETATGLLRRLIETYPQSSLVADARWWLALSYDKLGDYKEALAQYRLIARATRDSRYTVEAQRRIVELEQVLGVPSTPPKGLTALFAKPEQLPPVPEWDGWMQTLTQAGITAIIVEVTTTGGTSPGVYFKTGLATVHRDVLGLLVPAAHRQGVDVFAALTLRRMDWLESSLGWSDSAFDPRSLDVRPTVYLDLFHPAFQEYLIGFCADLADTGVDGVLFRGDAPVGPTDGLSPFALRAFERDFGLKLDPLRIFPIAKTTERPDSAPEFWRWLGWRARESLKLMDKLKRAMRHRSPKLRVAVELHPEAVTRPVDALLQYGEDLLEAKRSRFDYYVIASQPSVTVQPAALLGIAEQSIKLLGDTDRIWMTAALPEGSLSQVVNRIAGGSERMALPKGIGLVYMRNTAAVP